MMSLHPDLLDFYRHDSDVKIQAHALFRKKRPARKLMSIGNSSMLKVINPDTITEEPLETNNILVLIYHARRANLDIMR